jgi:diguanylate cyclase (GGDEF)-like protein
MYSLAAIMIDLNGLKFVNDSFGHVTGDKMLQKSSDIISKVFSKKKDLIYRIGVDEFLILRPNTSEEEIKKQCLRIKLESNKETCNEIPISFSIGYSLVNEPGMTLNDIMAYADDRMYMDKLVNRKSNKSGYLKALKNAVKEKSYETSSHDDRIVNIVKIMGTYINLDKEKMDSLVVSASLHDI